MNVHFQRAAAYYWFPGQGAVEMGKMTWYIGRGPQGSGSGGDTHSGKGPKSSPGMWEGDRPGGRSWSCCCAAGVPRSLPPRPVPGSEEQHWYKGWETGPWEESSACRRCRTLPHCSLLPFTRPEGGGSCQRKWAYIKASRKGQGQVRGATAQAGILPATPEGRDCRGQGP